MNHYLIIISLFIPLISTDVEIPSNWVDPTDMMDRTRGSRSSFSQMSDENYRKPYQRQMESVNNLQVVDNNANCKSLENDFRHIYSSHKRLINVLVNHLKLKYDAESEPSYVFHLNVVISKKEREILEQFGNMHNFDSHALREIDDLLSDIFLASQSQAPYMESAINWSYILANIFSSTQNLIIIFVSVASYMTYRLIYVRFSILRAFCILFFVTIVVGFGWTWYHLIEEEEIRLMAERMQYPIPPECNAQEMTWWQRWMSNSQVDCHKYARAHYKKAITSVTPQMVIAEMFGQSFSQIMLHCIQSISYFFSTMHSIIPWPLNILAFPFLLLFVLIVFMQTMVFIFGVDFRLSLFHLIDYQIGRRRRSFHSTPMPQLRHQRRHVYIEDVGEEPNIDRRYYIEDVKSRRQAPAIQSADVELRTDKIKRKPKSSKTKLSLESTNGNQQSTGEMEPTSSSTSSWEDIESDIDGEFKNKVEKSDLNNPADPNEVSKISEVKSIGSATNVETKDCDKIIETENTTIDKF